ncbi:MAG: diguanylate cyclase [Planctomycetota bacterium]
MPTTADSSPQALEARAKKTLAALGDRLPVRPGPLLDLLASAGEDPAEVTAIIERDPAMSARVLGVVNSAGNRRLNEITSVDRAILQLGPGQVRALGLAMGLQVLAEQMDLPPEMIRAFWNASLRKAEAAHLAAQAIDPKRTDSAYSAGLIADVGLPLLMGLDPDFYRDKLPLRPADRVWIEAERLHFGIDHAQAGAHVLGSWKVSAETCRRVRTHHTLPSHEADAGLTLALFVAGLLPHDDNEIDPPDLDRLVAVHGKVLAHAYASPDAFLGHVYVESQRRLNHDAAKDDGQGLELQPFLDAIAANTLHLVSQVTTLRHKQDQHKEDLSTLRFEAFTDTLTKVLNRRGFFGLAEQRLAKHPDGLGCCCMLLDLNKFKEVNDTYGHDAGDLMLRGLAKLLRRSVSRSDIIGRLGGDEFVVLLTGVDEHQARVAAARVRDTALHKKIRITAEHTIELSFSLGAVHHDRVGENHVQLDQMLAAADELMYQRKRAGLPGLIFARLDENQNDGSSILPGLEDQPPT